MQLIPIPPQAPANSGIATLAGTRLAYWDTGGSGETIVLLHPATGSADSWVHQQPVFAKAGYRLIAYSRRGYGGSDAVPKNYPGTAAGDLDALLDFLAVKKFHLVGSAAGGGLAVDYALSHSQRLLSLVVACAIGGVEDEDYAARIASLRPKGFEDMPASFRELSPSYRVSNPEGADAWAALERTAVTGNRHGQKPLNQVTWARLATLRLPTLIIGGDADLYMPPPMLRTFAAHIPGAELVIVPEAGHSLYWEQPDIFNRAVLDFLGKRRA
ncbi:MAG TPA: alpha/beta fold hydrolase [Micropepsaceae bacterium]|jgi:pimeloyl-ACP methyl ester carboxylesterase|nr:alpha/beta fold hydrolase [Micropepsaceae bacterium]